MTLIHWNYTSDELAIIALVFVGLFVAWISLVITIRWFLEMKRSADRGSPDNQP